MEEKEREELRWTLEYLSGRKAAWIPLAKVGNIASKTLLREMVRLVPEGAPAVRLVDSWGQYGAPAPSVFSEYNCRTVTSKFWRRLQYAEMDAIIGPDGGVA